MSTTKKLLKRAVEVREAARAVRDFPRSNRINSLLWLATQAGDRSEQTLDKLAEAVRA